MVQTAATGWLVIPRLISSLEVIRVIDGPMILTDCFTEHKQCDHSERCPVRRPLRRIHEGILRLLENVTILDMCETPKTRSPHRAALWWRCKASGTPVFLRPMRLRTFMKLPIYLDNHATTRMDPRVFDAMKPYFMDIFGNAASRNHSFGWEAEEAVEKSRKQIADLIGATAKEIVFTSGATESNNLAIKGVAEMYAEKGNHIITAVTEHKAILDTCKHLEKKGARVTYLAVRQDGLIDLDQLRDAITDKTILITIMYANNEIGVVQQGQGNRQDRPGRRGVLFHTDAVQAVGKIPVNVIQDNIDLLSLTGHKLYGPKGCGALYVRRRNPRVQLTSQMDGGGHERGMRSGTLNVPSIAGLGEACELCNREMAEESKRLSHLRDKLKDKLMGELDEVYINGSIEHRLPHNLNISFAYVEARAF